MWNFLAACVLVVMCGCATRGYNAGSLRASAEGPVFSAKLEKVSAWCDHMPIVGSEEPRRQYLIVEAVLKNNTGDKLVINLERSCISFEERRLGECVPAPGLSVRDGKSGKLTGVTSLTLLRNEERVVQFRGDGVYPEGQHGKTIYVTMVFAADRELFVLRANVQVLETS